MCTCGRRDRDVSDLLASLELGMRMSTGNSGTCTTCVCTTVVQVCGGTLIANYFMYWYF